MKIIDAHSHIEYVTHDFQPDVVGTVCCAKNESEWQDLIDTIKNDNCVYGAFGIHPWFVSNVQDGFEQCLEQLLLSNSKYMVGEIGLDKYKPNMEKQIDVFIKQLNIAIRLHRIIFIHCVGAWDKMLHIFKQYKQSELPKIIIHGFNENKNILDSLLQYDNVLFSFNKIGVYGGKCCIEYIPDNKILVETDGKSDVVLSEIVNKISEIKQNQNMCDIIYNNTLKVVSNE